MRQRLFNNPLALGRRGPHLPDHLRDGENILTVEIVD
jgi:hypothetical protein